MVKHQTLLDALQGRFQVLERENHQLEARVQSASRGIELANDVLQQLLATRHAGLSLGRWAQQLQLETRQHCCTLNALPPPEAWGGAGSPLTKWSSEQIRYLQYQGALHSSATLPENSLEVSAHARHASGLHAWRCAFIIRSLAPALSHALTA